LEGDVTLIVSPEERLTEPRGARILMIGPFGVGKTTQARGLDVGSTIVIDRSRIFRCRMCDCRPGRSFGT
jgi:hypothetical protein